MSEHKGAFRAVIKRKFPSEARIMDAFMSCDSRHITESLGELIGQNEQKYQKVTDILEANSVADEVIFSKWQSVQEQLNEAYFGFVNWDTILQELDGERAKQEAVIQSAALQREALRTRIPTSFIVPEPERVQAPEPLPEPVRVLEPVYVAPATDEPTQALEPMHVPITVDAGTFELDPENRESTSKLQPSSPSTKKELLAYVEKLYAQKKQELETIHKKKIALINTHGEKLLHEAVDDFLSRIRRLECVSHKIDDIFRGETLDPFLTSLHAQNTDQLSNKIAELQRGQNKRQNAISRSWQMAIENEELRKFDMLSKLKNQIAIARETYSCIEDSGVLDLEKIMQSTDAIPWDDMATNAHVQECKTRLLSDYLDEEALKHMRDTLLYLWNQTTEPEILVDMVNIFGSLLFSHLAPQSKGKLISVLIESMHNRSLAEAARILHHLAENDDLCYRLSERDMKWVLSLVDSQNDEIQSATSALIERQLQLEQEGLVPVSSSTLSQKLEEALAHLSLSDNDTSNWSKAPLRQSANRR